MSALDWSDAACVGQNPEIWFASDRDRDIKAAAIATCQTCPLQQVCLEAALAAEAGVHGALRDGIFGGITPTARARMRPRAAILAACGTPGAARRHKRLGEPVDGACADAEREYNRARKRRAA